jgi:hypothetical protein
VRAVILCLPLTLTHTHTHTHTHTERERERERERVFLCALVLLFCPIRYAAHENPQPDDVLLGQLYTARHGAKSITDINTLHSQVQGHDLLMSGGLGDGG